MSVVKSPIPSSDEVADDESDSSACDDGKVSATPPSASPPAGSSAFQLQDVKIPELCSTPELAEAWSPPSVPIPAAPVSASWSVRNDGLWFPLMIEPSVPGWSS